MAAQIVQVNHRDPRQPRILGLAVLLRYRERRLKYHKTKPTTVSIGERRRPDPQGQPGYLRVDTVHQGDQNTAKGVYHINAVDEVTQWQIVAATQRISEAWLEPVLQALLRQFPFRIRGFSAHGRCRPTACPLRVLASRARETCFLPRCCPVSLSKVATGAPGCPAS